MTNPWDRQRDEDGELEPALWFGRFDRFYRPQGTERSLLGAVNALRVTKGQKESSYTPGSWRKAFDEWNWKTRAEAWDEAERQKRLVEEEEERLQARAERKAIIRRAKGKLVEVMKNVDVKEPKVSELVMLAKMVLQEERAEYNDLPSQRHEVTGADGSELIPLSDLVRLLSEADRALAGDGGDSP